MFRAKIAARAFFARKNSQRSNRERAPGTVFGTRLAPQTNVQAHVNPLHLSSLMGGRVLLRARKNIASHVRLGYQAFCQIPKCVVGTLPSSVFERFQFTAHGIL